MEENSHVRLVLVIAKLDIASMSEQYDRYVPRFSYFAVLSLAYLILLFQRLLKLIAKHEKLGKYLLYYFRVQYDKHFSSFSNIFRSTP